MGCGSSSVLCDLHDECQGFQASEVLVVERGLCECGCGERTRLAEKTDRAAGWVRGEPLRFLRFHGRKGPRPEVRTRVDPNPEGVCRCGCGSAVAPYPSELPMVIHPRFVRGHSGRKSPVDYVVEARGFETPCWVWQRKLTRKGYGIVPLPDGSEQMAHRWVYEREVGPAPDGVDLHHRCEVKACVNPGHLEPLEHAEHVRRHWEVRRAAC